MDAVGHAGAFVSIVFGGRIRRSHDKGPDMS